MTRSPFMTRTTKLAALPAWAWAWAWLLATPAPVLADSEEALQAAKARYEQGERSFAAGRFLEAAAEFEAAYKLSPRSDLLYDAGHAYDKGGDTARAVELYERYLLAGDGLPEEAAVKARLLELAPKVARLKVEASQPGAKVFIDGKERGTTPMPASVPLGSGVHRIEVRLGELSFRTEQEFALGLSHTVRADLAAPPQKEENEGPPSKRFVGTIGLGGVIDIKSNNFPPSQAALLFGFEYRLYERRPVAVDVSVYLPLQVAQGWTTFGILPGLRLVLQLSQKVPLELVPALNLGLGILHRTTDAPPTVSKTPLCGGSPQCTLPGLRIKPSLNLVYRFLPNWEARAEVFGLEADITTPIGDPRVSFGLSAAWRFY